MIKKFNQYLLLEKATGLTKHNIPQKIISFLFDKKLLLSHNIDAEKLKNKRIVAENIQYYDILSYLNEDEIVFISPPDSGSKQYKIMEYFNDKYVYSYHNKTKALSYIKKNYKSFLIRNNKHSDKKLGQIQKTEEEYDKRELYYSMTDTLFNFINKKLNELKENIVNDITEYIPIYRASGKDNSDETKARVMLSAISNINILLNISSENNIGYHYDEKILNKREYLLYKLIFMFKQWEYYNSKEYANEKEQIKDYIISFSRQWTYEDFYDIYHPGRKILTSIERKKEKIKEFNI